MPVLAVDNDEPVAAWAAHAANPDRMAERAPISCAAFFRTWLRMAESFDSEGNNIGPSGQLFIRLQEMRAT